MKHLLLKVEGAVSQQEFVIDTLLQACDNAGARVRRVVEHTFFPHGFSAAVILAESHASIHTWPETGTAYVDYFSCADDPKEEEFANTWVKRGFALKDKKIVLR